MRRCLRHETALRTWKLLRFAGDTLRRASRAREHGDSSRTACVSASVLFISSEKISDAAMDAKGVSSPNAFAMPMAIAVLPVPGCPASNTARPAIFPSRIIDRICSAISPPPLFSGASARCAKSGPPRVRLRAYPGALKTLTHLHPARSSAAAVECGSGLTGIHR
jgi:hypothetical protein